VEFAIRLPGREGDSLVATQVWLPIDSKFPVEDYERIVAAHDLADLVAMEEAAKALGDAHQARGEAIRDKYVEPPHTTDFAILFLPTEGLYAEVLRRPGLADWVQRECRVTISGPTTLMAVLNSLQMGFRTLAIENAPAMCGWCWRGQNRIRQVWRRARQDEIAVAKRRQFDRRRRDAHAPDGTQTQKRRSAARARSAAPARRQPRRQVGAEREHMLWQIVSLLKRFFLPPLALGWLLLVAWLLMRKHPRAARSLLGVALAGLYFAATPLCSNWLMERFVFDHAPPAAAAPQVIVVLGAGRGLNFDASGKVLEGTPIGSTMERLVTGARLAKMTGLPLLVTGGKPTATTRRRRGDARYAGARLRHAGALGRGRLAQHGGKR